MHESMLGQARQFRKLTNCNEPFGNFRMKKSQGAMGLFDRRTAAFIQPRHLPWH